MTLRLVLAAAAVAAGIAAPSAQAAAVKCYGSIICTGGHPLCVSIRFGPDGHIWTVWCGQ